MKKAFISKVELSHFKLGIKVMDKISVITVCFNAADVLEMTIQTIINQSYQNIEYIIIDGASNDTTLDIIKKYNNNISMWKSEPDDGIYDAMNKAIDAASGDWIIFMNAGDCFVGNDVLDNVFSKDIDKQVGVLYGDTIIKHEWGNFYWEARFFSKNDKHLPFSHQSVFVRTQLMKQYYFDLSYKVAADYNFFYLLYKDGIIFKHLLIPISIYDAIGFSSSVGSDLFKEVCRINGNNNKHFYWFNLQIMRIRNILKKILPNSFIAYYRKNKYGIKNRGYEFIKKKAFSYRCFSF